MRMAGIASAIILLTISAAGAATDDYSGVIKVQAAYGTQTTVGTPQIDINVDVTYDIRGDGWGTLSYGRPATSSLAASRVYAHALCVGKFSSAGNVVVVTGRVAKSLGVAFPAFLSFEFDLTNKRIRARGLATEALARANCKTPTGVFPSAFTFGFVIVK
jgi:hypothetical protein